MIYLKQVHPNSSDWETFLDLSVSYLLTYWPNLLSEKTFFEFRKSYAQDILNKYHLGNRGLFLVVLESSIVGIVNVYLLEDDLQIAEFFLLESERGKGNGSKMKQLVEEWGLSKKVQRLIIEVDKNFKTANLFWSSFEDLKLDQSGKRNVYSKEL